MGFGVHERLGLSDYKYLTVLRHPVDRVLSAFEEVRLGPNSADMNLHAFLASDGSPVWTPSRYPFWGNNGQLRYLAGVSGQLLDTPPGELNQSHLDLAIDRLRHEIAVTLILEDLPRSIRLLEHELGLGRLNPLPANVKHHRAGRRRESVNAEVRDQIEEANQLDVQLYEAATRQVEDRLERLDEEAHSHRSHPIRAFAAQGLVKTALAVAPTLGRCLRGLKNLRNQVP